MLSVLRDNPWLMVLAWIWVGLGVAAVVFGLLMFLAWIEKKLTR